MKRFILNFFIVLIPLLAAGYFGYQFIQEREAVSPIDTDTKTVKPELPEGPIEEVETPAASGTLDCTNCWLAPVDKENSLSSSYAPATVALSVSGGGRLTAEAASALNNLFAAAEKADIDMYVRSAYRSYQTQAATFEKWVQVEMADGYSRQEAEARANTYSAKPGHSEHQLGTTVDLLCSGCDFESSANQPIWNWLADHAGDFGFVLSYPEGRTDETGYTSEPWHYRFIGKSRAAEYNAQTSLTLNQWLAR